ncbi:MAG: T9SS type A sorting domain-containing protein [Bacteroidales bacterium]|nr:T9SS type A sorting domain-containing protein [Bacteroidales bacterium]
MVINGGKLTKACNELWDGIEVHGQPLFRQTPEYQGLIDIKNGGTIEFAKTAIITGKKDNGIIINGFEGGIIIAENATFRDNEIDIEMLPYRDNVIVPPFTWPNQSRFKECAFITDAVLYEYSYPSAHIRLDGIYGLQITSCEFKNDVGFEKWTVNYLGTGIYSFNSTFLLKRACSLPIPPCPEEYLIPCRFEGLNYGIRAFNWSEIYNLSINKVDFVNNLVGIYLSGVNQAEITRNTFNCITNIVGDYNGSFLGGIYLDDCTGYKVEENSINGPQSIPPHYEVKSIGIYVKNSGVDDNEIYNNTFRNQYIAIQAEGINRGDRTGLCLKCNKLIANKNDFVVSPDQRIQSLSWGIKGLQGTFEELPDAPAGNEFREYSNEEVGVNNNGILKNWNYYNDGNHVTYIQHVTPPYKYKPGDHNYYSDNTFRRYQTTIQYDNNSCPSHIQDPVYKDFYDPRLTMENAGIQAALYQTLLDTLIDGGDTYSLNQDVMMGLPNEALELWQRLINESPYLSDTVIKSAIYKENVLPNAMIRDIMVLNPQTAKSNEFINLLDYRMAPMSDTMMSEILEGQGILGSKEILESHLSYWSEKKAFARNDLIRSWLSDTTIYHPYDSIIELFQNENDIDAIYRLASCFTNNNQFTEALSTLQIAPSIFQLTEEKEDVYQDYLTYFNIVKMMNDSSINAYELDSTSINALSEIMDHGYPQVGGYSRGLLVNGNHIQFYETVAPVGEYKSSKIPASGYKRPENKINDHLKVFPNPATDFIIADFNTLALSSYGEIRIVDMNGKLCKAIPLLKYQDQIVINLSNLTSGTYTVMLWVDNKPIVTKKLLKVNE